MFGLFRTKAPVALSPQAAFLLELFDKDGWRVRDRFDKYLFGQFGETWVEVSLNPYREYTLKVRVKDRFFYVTDHALEVPLTARDRSALTSPFCKLIDRLRKEAAEQEDRKAIELLTPKDTPQ